MMISIHLPKRLNVVQKSIYYVINKNCFITLGVCSHLRDCILHNIMHMRVKSTE